MGKKVSKDKLVQGTGCVFITDKPGVLISACDGNTVWLTIPEARRLLDGLPAAIEDSIQHVKKNNRGCARNWCPSY